MKLLTIKRSKELPQWIISSPRAAYHFSSRTIYIRADFTGTEYAEFLIHELGHWIIDLLTLRFNNHIRHRIQETYDELYRAIYQLPPDNRLNRRARTK